MSADFVTSQGVKEQQEHKLDWVTTHDGVVGKVIWFQHPTPIFKEARVVLKLLNGKAKVVPLRNIVGQANIQSSLKCLIPTKDQLTVVRTHIRDVCKTYNISGAQQEEIMAQFLIGWIITLNTDGVQTKHEDCAAAEAMINMIKS